MRRPSAICLALLMLAALTPGVAEVLENVEHLVREGHLAHAAPDGDQHRDAGPEHGCTGTMHLCSCCVSLPFLASRPAALAPNVDSRFFDREVEMRRLPLSSDGLDHPPRV